MAIYSKLSTLFQKLTARLIDFTDEVAIQSYAMPQEMIEYSGAVKLLPPTAFITAQGREMQTTVPADFNPYYRASLIVAEDLAPGRSHKFSLYIRLERRVERDEKSFPSFVEYFPLMETKNQSKKEEILSLWNKDRDLALSWLSRDLGAIPRGRWQDAAPCRRTEMPVRNPVRG